MIVRTLMVEFSGRGRGAGGCMADPYAVSNECCHNKVLNFNIAEADKVTTSAPMPVSDETGSKVERSADAGQTSASQDEPMDQSHPSK